MSSNHRGCPSGTHQLSHLDPAQQIEQILFLVAAPDVTIELMELIHPYLVDRINDDTLDFTTLTTSSKRGASGQTVIRYLVTRIGSAIQVPADQWYHLIPYCASQYATLECLNAVIELAVTEPLPSNLRDCSLEIMTELVNQGRASVGLWSEVIAAASDDEPRLLALRSVLAEHDLDGSIARYVATRVDRIREVARAGRIDPRVIRQYRGNMSAEGLEEYHRKYPINTRTWAGAIIAAIQHNQTDLVCDILATVKRVDPKALMLTYVTLVKSFAVMRNSTTVQDQIGIAFGLDPIDSQTGIDAAVRELLSDTLDAQQVPHLQHWSRQYRGSQADLIQSIVSFENNGYCTHRYCPTRILAICRMLLETDDLHITNHLLLKNVHYHPEIKQTLMDLTRGGPARYIFHRADNSAMMVCSYPIPMDPWCSFRIDDVYYYSGDIYVDTEREELVRGVGNGWRNGATTIAHHVRLVANGVPFPDGPLVPLIATETYAWIYYGPEYQDAVYARLPEIVVTYLGQSDHKRAKSAK